MEWAYVLYRGAPLWHQRWVAGKLELSACEYGIVTPDFDVYLEDFGTEDGSDAEAVRYGCWTACYQSTVHACCRPVRGSEGMAHRKLCLRAPSLQY